MSNMTILIIMSQQILDMNCMVKKVIYMYLCYDWKYTCSLKLYKIAM